MLFGWMLVSLGVVRAVVRLRIAELLVEEERLFIALAWNIALSSAAFVTSE